LRLDDLEGKLVLVTGASTGIGAAVSRAFAAQGARVAVHFNAHSQAAAGVAGQIREAGGAAVLVQGELSRPDTARRVVEESAAALGGLDVLINNAGSLVARRPFLETDDAFLDAVFDLNVRAVIAAVRSAVPYMEARSGGAIINVGSVAALDGGGPGTGMYAGSKSFVHSLTRHLARDLAARNIRVNTVAPGVIDTAFHAATPPERMDAMKKAVCLGRIGTPADCVGAFLFLASAALSGYITGQIIHVNGGQVMP
jgi:3-oxoacyl-[acyl-carrier protein] reductase